MMDRKMACLDKGHLPQWWTEEMSVSQEMRAEGETEGTEICKQCNFFVGEHKMCDIGKSCRKCNECCQDDKENIPEE